MHGLIRSHHRRKNIAGFQLSLETGNFFGKILKKVLAFYAV